MQAEIIKDPSKYVELDPDMAQSLMDMRQAVSIHTTYLIWQPTFIYAFVIAFHALISKYICSSF